MQAFKVSRFNVLSRHAHLTDFLSNHYLISVYVGFMTLAAIG